MVTRIAPMVGVEGIQPMDLVVVGSVAVNKHGARLGKSGVRTARMTMNSENASHV
jgi:hypothetical protein